MSSKKPANYLNSQQVAERLNVSRDAARQTMRAMSARGAEVLKLSGLRIRAADFERILPDFRL